MTTTPTPQKNHYINNKDFLRVITEYRREVQASLETGADKPQVPEYIGQCFIDIANNLAFKSNFINYSYREDMILDAIENCLTYIDNFDPAKSTNPFGYFTTICYYAFVRRIQKEKRQLHTKYKYIESLDLDSLILQSGDDSEYGSAFIDFLKKQADTAHTELGEIKKDSTAMKRKPKYLQAIEDAKVEEIPEA